MENEDLGNVAEASAEILHKLSDCDVLVYVGPITKEGFERVVTESPRSGNDRVLLLLATVGGDPDAAFRVAQFLRRSYDQFTVFAPSLCKSAGTLLCIGAGEIVISETGELGPLDVQVQNPDDLADYGSGLDMPTAFRFLQEMALETLRSALVDAAGGGLGTKRSAEIATNMTVGLFSPIFTQIDPSRLGGNARALSIAREYAGRLQGNIKSDEALEQLVGGYPSHSFAIDREETAELFKAVRAPNEIEEALERSLKQLLTTSSIRRTRNARVYWLEGDSKGECDETRFGERRSDQADPTGEGGSPDKVDPAAGEDATTGIQPS